MITALIFGLAIMVIYSTAQPVLWLRFGAVIWLQHKVPQLSRLLECLSCSSFWIGIGTYLLLPYVPEFLQYAIYLYALVTLIEILKYKYFDGTH